MNVFAHTTFWDSRVARRLLTTTLVLSLACLAACSRGGSSEQDSVRIGSGQTANSGTVNGVDYPIFYVKRVTPDFTSQNTDTDVRHLRVFSTNADLYMRDRSSPSATERNITARVHPANELWDIKDVDVSADGTKVIFAMRGPIDEDMDDDETPTWNIWEYDISSDTLRRVISTNSAAEEGQDVSPHYLPDGHILFSSTRQYQSKAILLDEGKGQFEAQDENRNESSFVLHVMDANGSNIKQVSFNQSHDMDATVLSSGRVLFSRWDHMRGTNRNGIHFYSAKPNGTDTQLAFGANSHVAVPNTAADGTITFPAVQYTRAKEMSDGRILTLVKPFSGTELGGDLYLVDIASYVEANQTLVGASPANAALTKSTPYNVQVVAGPSIGGRFVSAAPFWDGTGRLLVSWTQCRVIDPNTQAAVNCTASNVADPTFTAAAPLYGLWVMNPTDGTQLPIIAPKDGVMITEVAIAQPRKAPTFLPFTLDADTTLTSTFKSEGVGVLDIRSVYDFDGTESATGTGCNIAGNANPTSTCFANRPARFLRVEKAVSLPSRDVYDFDNSAFGASNFMREILGYVPIEPDGSVQLKVPGDVAFQITITDANGRAVNTFPRHNAWLSVRPGETVQCNGCHRNSTNLTAGQSGRSHGRSGATTSVYAGATSAVFANANGTFSAVTGQTMAQARATWSCANEQCASITPSVNLLFANVWPSSTTDSRTNPTTARTGDTAIVYAGTGGITTKVPTNNSTCLTTWSNSCRITINYLEHIQPIWERPLGIDVNGDTLADANDTCQVCHNRTNAANATQIPAGQLELTTDASDQNGAGIRITAYQELFFNDNELELTNNVLQDRCVNLVVDPITNVATCAQFSNVPPPLAARNAAGSRFFNVFETNQCRINTGASNNGAIHTCTFNHTTLLTRGELRLIAEWVDVGGQYYNNPFKAPEN